MNLNILIHKKHEAIMQRRDRNDPFPNPIGTSIHRSVQIKRNRDFDKCLK